MPSRIGAGSGCGGSPDLSTRRQNGVNTRKSPAFLVADVDGCHQEIAGKAVSGDADLPEAGRELFGHRLMRRLRDLVPEHGVGAGLARELGDDPSRRPRAQHQRHTERAEPFLQRAQRLRQPPARRAAERTRGRGAECRALLVEHVEADHRRAGRRSGVQGGMIGKPQIVAEPDDAGSGGVAGHRTVNAGGARWVRAIYGAAGFGRRRSSVASALTRIDRIRSAPCASTTEESR